ncbi:MAG: alpha/beta hydrolase, partial [Rhodobacteraceae bacterium]
MRSTPSRLAGVICAGLAIAACAIALPSPSSAQDGAIAREVPFLTLRNRTGSGDPRTAFGDERSGLSAGSCRVRNIDLGGLTPLAEAAPASIREEFLRVEDVRETDGAQMFDALQATAADRAPAIYVHGYYIGFEKGCRRAVLLQQNAGLAGRFLWFSWPSDGALAYYTHDEADLYWSVPD